MSRSLGFKLGAIALLILLLMIPLLMIDGLVDERQGLRHEVLQDIARSSSYRQQITGPILVLPYIKTTHEWKTNEKTGERYSEERQRRGRLYFLPERFGLDFNGGLLLPGSWGVIANNPAGDTAFQVVAKLLDPEIQAKVFAATGLSPSNPAAEAFVPADLAAINPTSAANAAKQQLVDVAWYTENQERVQTKFLELISG